MCNAYEGLVRMPQALSLASGIDIVRPIWSRSCRSWLAVLHTDRPFLYVLVHSTVKLAGDAHSVGPQPHLVPNQVQQMYENITHPTPHPRPDTHLTTAQMARESQVFSITVVYGRASRQL